MKTEGAAGYDVCASEECTIPAHSRYMVETGVALELPPTLFASIRGRSGLASRGIDVHPGTIDSDYRGHIKIIVINNTNDKFDIKPGDRIAQLVFEQRITPSLTMAANALVATKRGGSGFGSTGME
jgi:dUTP pyrophosphatase